jgi:hypothetical protein
MAVSVTGKLSSCVTGVRLGVEDEGFCSGGSTDVADEIGEDSSCADSARCISASFTEVLAE